MNNYLMNKSLLIDFKVLEEQEITVDDLLQLYNIYNKSPITKYDFMNVDYLESKLFIKKIENKIHLREKAIQLIDFLLIDTNNSFENNTKQIGKSKRVINQIVEKRIDEFRDKWKGLKAGSMGSRKSCIDKLTRWMKENPKYSFEDVLKAADLYLHSINDYNYIQQADYFIFKQDNSKTEASRLSAFIDDLDMKEVTDWTSNLN